MERKILRFTLTSSLLNEMITKDNNFKGHERNSQVSMRYAKRSLPPLAGMIAADAVARLSSFTAAADELHVTPSAISHRIKALEDWLGFALFTRNTRSVTMTSLGRDYLNDVAESLSGLENITAHAQARAGKAQVIRLQTTDSFANRWLVDRLPTFLQTHPNISVQIITREYTEGFRTSDADIAVLYGQGDWEGCIATALLEETIFPVVSPKILKDIHHKDEIFQHCPLIHDDNLGTSWLDWWQSAAINSGNSQDYESSAGLHYNHSHLALKAAEQGCGVALASEPLVVDALSHGQLIAPFKYKHCTEYGYYLLQRHESQQYCLLFVDWLLDEAIKST